MAERQPLFEDILTRDFFEEKIRSLVKAYLSQWPTFTKERKEAAKSIIAIFRHFVKHELDDEWRWELTNKLKKPEGIYKVK